MSLLRKPGQVAMNELLVNLEKNAAYYRDAADWVDHASISPALRRIAERRDVLVERMRQAIQRMGGLPDRADPERQGMAKLVKRVEAAASPDQRARAIQQRLDEDRDLDRLAGELREAEVSGQCDEVLSELSRQIQTDRAYLKQFLEEDD